MSWQQDAQVMEALDVFLTNQQGDLNALMETLSEHMDETPVWGMVVLYGKFVMYYNTQRENDSTETEAFQESVARLGNDPLTQALVANYLAL